MFQSWGPGEKLRDYNVIYGCFLKQWYPQIIRFNRVFHYKPSILGYPYFWKHPYLMLKQRVDYMLIMTFLQRNLWCTTLRCLETIAKIASTSADFKHHLQANPRNSTGWLLKIPTPDSYESRKGLVQTAPLPMASQDTLRADPGFFCWL